MIFTIKGPVYTYFEVENPGKHGMYIGLSQDILGVYYSRGEVSKDTLQMINIMTQYNNAEYDYKPTWSNQSYGLDIEISEFVKNYIDTFVKNPVIMMRAIIDREDALWDIFCGQDSVVGCVNYTGTQDGATQDSVVYWNDYYPEREYVSLHSLASAESSYTASSQWISVIEWRCGLFTLFGLVAFVYMLIRNGFKKYLVISAPSIGHIFSLLLSTGWTDFRYFWPMNLLNMAILLLTVVIMRQENKIINEVENV